MAQEARESRASGAAVQRTSGVRDRARGRFTSIVAARSIKNPKEPCSIPLPTLEYALSHCWHAFHVLHCNHTVYRGLLYALKHSQHALLSKVFPDSRGPSLTLRTS